MDFEPHTFLSNRMHYRFSVRRYLKGRGFGIGTNWQPNLYTVGGDSDLIQHGPRVGSALPRIFEIQDGVIASQSVTLN